MGALQDWRFDMYDTCDQDESLISGECFLVCRFGLYPTQRCIHRLDRDGKYGVSDNYADASGYHHCEVLSLCEELPLNETHMTTREVNELHCNQTGATRTVANALKPEEDNSIIVVILAAAGCALLLIVCLLSLLLYKKSRQRGSPKTSRDDNTETSGEGVVMGRPIGDNGGENVASGTPAETNAKTEDGGKV